MIISNKKASSLFFQLEKEGYSEEDISRVKFPAGMDINANTPEEIAVSILAELINDRNSVDLKEQVIVESKEDKKKIDPICKMIVDPKNAADTYEFDDINYYFCCTGCKEKFALEPSSYIN